MENSSSGVHFYNSLYTAGCCFNNLIDCDMFTAYVSAIIIMAFIQKYFD